MVRTLEAALIIGLVALTLVGEPALGDGASGSEGSVIDGQVTSDGGSPEAGVWVMPKRTTCRHRTEKS